MEVRPYQQSCVSEQGFGWELSADESNTYKLLLEDHISVLFFFGSQAMLSCAVLCCQDRFLPAQDHTAGTVPAAADPCCRTAFGKGPKLSLYFTDFTQAIQTLKHNLASFLLRRR